MERQRLGADGVDKSQQPPVVAAILFLRAKPAGELGLGLLPRN